MAAAFFSSTCTTNGDSYQMTVILFLIKCKIKNFSPTYCLKNTSCVIKLNSDTVIHKSLKQLYAIKHTVSFTKNVVFYPHQQCQSFRSSCGSAPSMLKDSVKSHYIMTRPSPVYTYTRVRNRYLGVNNF